MDWEIFPQSNNFTGPQRRNEMSASELPEVLESGDLARLIPIVADTSVEQRVVTQAEIQPFADEKKAFKDSHFYPLPWPQEALEGIGDQTVQLKITLSYFVEPNPGFSSTIDPYRYQSFGLRFDLRRRGETTSAFAKRVNAKERAKGEKVRNATDSDEWLFGRNSISAGSVHCDVWSGPASHLLSRNMICIHPVGGWWRNRAAKAIRCQKTRYALVVSLKAPDSKIDLYTPIQTLIDNNIEIELPF